VREDLDLPAYEDGQRRRLHPTRRPGAPLPAALEALGERAGGVHPDQPVRVGAALCSGGQPLELLPGPQRLEAAADGSAGHRLEPEPLDRLLAPEEIDDLAEDQLAFTTSVAGVHDAFHVVALQQLADGADAVALSLLLLELEALRKDGKIGEGPALVLGIDLLGRQQLEQMADRERDHVVVALPEPIVFLEAAERGGDVASDARLLGDDERFGHRTPCRLRGRGLDRGGIPPRRVPPRRARGTAAILSPALGT
jgi:hypothetical protein